MAVNGWRLFYFRLFKERHAVLSGFVDMDAWDIYGWNDYTMDASTWWGNESVTPIQAAMLLCRHNPNIDTEQDAAIITTDETTPQDFNRLKNSFEAASNTKRTLGAWADYAAKRGLKVHSWLAQWRKAAQQLEESGDAYGATQGWRR